MGLLSPTSIRNVTKVAADVARGQHAEWPPNWPVARTPPPDDSPYIAFHGNSSWYLMHSFESWNGRWPGPASQIANQSSYQLWFSENAFGGSNYFNTPVGAVSHVSEPGAIVYLPVIYFGLWQQGKSFAIAAWNTGSIYVGQVTGDPFIKR